jgi:hypothetical protein
MSEKRTIDDASHDEWEQENIRLANSQSAGATPDKGAIKGVAAVAAGSAASNKMWQAMQLKADMFDYLCWLDGMQSPEELHGVQRLCIASDGTTCWGHTYAEAVRVAMEHDKEIFDAMQTQPPIGAYQPRPTESQ